MKAALTITVTLACVVFAFISHGQNFTNSGADFTGLKYSSVDWGDYDNDGDLDLLVTGDSAISYPVTRLYRNDGNNQFTGVNAGLLPVLDSDADWGDYDLDGFPDLVISGDTMVNGLIQHYYLVRLFHNNGNGTFTLADPGIPVAGKAAVAWADFDNDGDPDLICMSKQTTGGSATIRIYQNDGNGVFTDSGISLSGSDDGVVECGDMNNDGRVDLVSTGSTGFTRVWFNNGNNTFTASISLIQPSDFADLEIADFDNDGDPDFVVAGLPIYNLVENTTIYRNNGNGTFSEVMAGLAGVKSAGLAWGDYDNDGDADLFLSGKLHSLATYTRLYRNDGSDVFTEMSYGFTPVYSGAAAWADSDLDHDLDLIVQGQTDLSGFQYAGILYQSSGFTSNTVPAAPTNLNALAEGGNVTFTWSPTTDGQTPSAGLSYNIRIGTTPGGIDIISPLSFVTDGKRKVQKAGNVSQKTGWMIKNLPNGTYYWSVQAIDGAFAGSPFAPEQSFTVGQPATADVTTLPASGVTTSTATLHGSVTAGDLQATAGFRILLGTTWTDVPAIPATIPAGTQSAVSAEVTGLTPSTTYSYFALASQTPGDNTPQYFYGDTLLFTTSEFSVPITGDTATAVTFYSARLQGSANPSGIPTAVSFELGTDTTYGYNITAEPDTLTGGTPVAFLADITGIAPATTYHFRVMTANTLGVFYGPDRTFTTLPVPAGNFTFKPEKCINKAGTYSDLGSQGTVIAMPGYDDSDSDPVDIGFEFSFAGATFSQFIVNSNGFVKLGNLPPADSVQFFDGPRTSTGGIFHSAHFADHFLLSPFNHDLQPGTSPPEFRVSIEGEPGSRICIIQFKNLQEKAEPPFRQFDNMEFQVRLHETTNVIEFSYGSWQASAAASAYRMAAVGIKGGGNTDSQILTVNKLSTNEWSLSEFTAGDYCQNCNTFNYGHAPRPVPDPGRTFMFFPKQAHDATVTAIYTLGKLPIPYGLPHDPAVHIRNTGYDTLYNIPVTFAITGSNTFGGVDTIPLLKPDSGAVVTFPGFNPAIPGFDSVTVTIPDDDFDPDNSALFIQEITENSYNYCDTTPYIWGLGFTWIGAPGSPAGLWLNRYHVNGVKNILSARIGLGAGNGQNVYAVVLDSDGHLLAQSATYPLTEENSWQFHEFTFPEQPLISNSSFYIGLAQTESPQTYYPIGMQIEDPVRRYACYTSQLDGSGLTESFGAARYCIEAVMDSGFCKPVFGDLCSDPNYGQFIDGFTTSGGAANISNLNTGCSGNANNYSYFPDKVVAVEKGTPFSFTALGVNLSWYSGIAIWADWNNDGDFFDPLELAHQGGHITPGRFDGTISVPLSSVTGQIRMRVLLYHTYSVGTPEPCQFYASGETEDYMINILPPTPMICQSGTVFQCDTSIHVAAGSTDVPVIGIRIETLGALDPLVACALVLNPGGSTNPARDVAGVHVYYTGSDSLFSASHLFGTALQLNDTITGLDTLNYGSNFFWVAVDVSDTAIVGDLLDAACTHIAFAGATGLTPAITDPAGGLTINYCIPTFSYVNSGCDWGYGINSVVTTLGMTNISNTENGCADNSYDYEFYPDQQVTVEQGAPFQLFMASTGADPVIRMFADWNRDGDFSDAGEEFYSGGGYTADVSVNVPADATPGISRLRILTYWQEYRPGNTIPVPGCGFISGGGETEDYKLTIMPATPMIVTGTEVFQCDTLPPVQRGSSGNSIIGIRISTSGHLSPLNLTSIELSSEGSDDFHDDVSQVKVYYTGYDSVFSTTNLFGSAADLGSAISGNITLAGGDNFFWVAYDARDTATIGHDLDASCTGINISGLATVIPANPSPEGKQRIDYCIPSFSVHTSCTSGYVITGFSTSGGIGNISNPGNGCAVNLLHDYSRFTNKVVTVRQGDQFQFTAEGLGHLAMYIDWNSDYDFSETNEMVSYNQLTGTITVPEDAVTGETRLRAIIFWFPGPGAPPGGCGTRQRGETEDYTIRILPMVPASVIIQNVTVQPGMDTCFSATQTITVAGQGSAFTVAAGGSATFMAGQKILFQPVSKVLSGGYMHAYIETGNAWCPFFMSPGIPVHPGAIADPALPTDAVFVRSGALQYSVWPNPSDGRFTLEIIADKADGIGNAECYDMMGRRMATLEIRNGKNMVYFSDFKPGIYLLKGMFDGQQFAVKVIRR